MKRNEFESLAEGYFSDCTNILREKGKQYSEDDRLEGFKRGSSLTGLTPEQVLMPKLYDKVERVFKCATSDEPSEAKAREIKDTINYLVLLSALIEEKEAPTVIDTESKKNKKDKKEEDAPVEVTDYQSDLFA